MVTTLRHPHGKGTACRDPRRARDPGNLRTVGRSAAPPQSAIPLRTARKGSDVAVQPSERSARSRSAASDYTARHLSVLEGLEAVRKRPGMYIGSTDARGLMHCLW